MTGGVFMIVYSDKPWLQDLIQKADPIIDFLRNFGWGLLKILAKTVDVLYEAINSLLGLNILEIDSVQGFINSVSPLTWPVLTIALIVAGIMIVLYPSKKKGEIARSLLLSAILMISIPFMFTTLNQFKDASIGDLNSSISVNGSAGAEILQSTTYDVQNSKYNKTLIDRDNDIYYLDITQRIPKDDDTFKYKIESKRNGVLYGKELGNGWFGWGEERIYAYVFNFFESLLILTVTLICLLFSGFKIGRLIFELIVHQAIAPIVFASDITGSGRTKKFMQSLISTYIVMVMILLGLKLYISLTTWATLNVTSIWVRILLIAGASWGVIDGPDIVLKLIGIDAGVRSAAATVMAIGGMANGAMGLAKGGVGVAQGAVNAVKNAPQNIAGAAGGIAGSASGIRNMVSNGKLGNAVARNPEESRLNGVTNMGEMNSVLGNDRTENKTSGYSNTPKSSSANGINNTNQTDKGFVERIADTYRNSRDTHEGKITRNAADLGYASGKATESLNKKANYKPPTGGNE